MWRLLRLVATLAAFIAAGCGEDDEGRGGGGSVTVPAGKDVRVVSDEYSFDPARIVIDAAPDELPTQVKLTLANEGTLAHNLKLFEGDTELGGTPTFQGGRTRSGIVDLEPGRYRMVCTVGDHAELGMVGELEVRER